MEPMVKVLEHCCYKRYLNEWWTECPSDEPVTWHLVHFGDQLMWELIEWCANICYCQGGVEVTVAVPVITIDTLDILARMKQITKLTILSQQIPDATLPPHVRCVSVPDLHTQTVTVARLDGQTPISFILTGGLLQQTAPGKYIVTLSSSPQLYSSIQPQLASWARFYSRK